MVVLYMALRAQKKLTRQSGGPAENFSRCAHAFAYVVRVAQIVITTHDFDDFGQRRNLLLDLVALWRADGHEIIVTAGLENWPDAGIAISHVDQTVVPDAYVQACKRYPKVINGRAERGWCIAAFSESRRKLPVVCPGTGGATAHR